MFNRIRTVISGGFVSAVIFGCFGAPEKWQALAAVTGSIITLVMLLDRAVPQPATEGRRDASISSTLGGDKGT